MMFNLPVLADSVWESDGSLTIIESSEPTYLFIDGSGDVQVETQVSSVMSQHLFMAVMN